MLNRLLPEKNQFLVLDTESIKIQKKFGYLNISIVLLGLRLFEIVFFINKPKRRFCKTIFTIRKAQTGTPVSRLDR